MNTILATCICLVWNTQTAHNITEAVSFINGLPEGCQRSTAYAALSATRSLFSAVDTHFYYHVVYCTKLSPKDTK